MKEETTLSDVAIMWCIVIAIFGVMFIVSQKEIEPISEHVSELKWEELR